MKDSMANFIHRRKSWRLAATAVVVLLVTSMAAVFATKISWSSPTQQGANMKPGFVFIFRQGHKTLSEEEQKRRTEEVRSWAYLKELDIPIPSIYGPSGDENPFA